MKTVSAISRKKLALAAAFLAVTCVAPAAYFNIWRWTQNSIATSKPARLVVDNSDAETGNTPNTEATSNVKSARKLAYKIVGTFAHDAKAFTEGLLWHDGAFYESVGLPNRSDVRRVAFPSGRVLESRKNDAAVFGEGLAIANDELVQLTWQNQIAFRYNRKTLKPVGKFSYDGEGWGLTFDGKQFVMSNGSDVLTFRDAKTFAIKRQIHVTWDEKPLTQLNELEWIDGKIWANVWRENQIVQIDPQSGRVVSYLDLTGLLAQNDANNGEDVLNGIAYDAQKKRVFITGKLWPKLFQIEVK